MSNSEVLVWSCSYTRMGESRLSLVYTLLSCLNYFAGSRTAIARRSS